MLLDRRMMLAGSAALAAMPGIARAQRGGGWYDRAVVIDGLGGLSDPYADSDVSRLTDRTWKEMQETGVTVLRDTVFPAGNTADPWGDYTKAIDGFRQAFAANPDRLILVRSAADILTAKRTRKFGVVVGTQDSCMVSGDLARIAQLKKDGVMTIQLTYNNGNLAGDGALDQPRGGAVGQLVAQLDERELASLRGGRFGQWIVVAARGDPAFRPGGNDLVDFDRPVIDARTHVADDDEEIAFEIRASVAANLVQGEVLDLEIRLLDNGRRAMSRRNQETLGARRKISK